MTIVGPDDGQATDQEKPRVALYVTCLVDLLRPSIGFATAELLADAGMDVIVPHQQSCCGNPAFNNGDLKSAQKLAKQVISIFETYDHVVIPSGSCAGMFRRHYPSMFADQDPWKKRAKKLAEKSHELTSFLSDVLGVRDFPKAIKASCTYHDSCSCLRDLQIARQPRELLSRCPGLALAELPENSSCCGFGGTFAVKYAEISTEIARKKVDTIVATGATTLLSADLGCLLHLAGYIHRKGKRIRVLHIAEALAGYSSGIFPSEYVDNSR